MSKITLKELPCVKDQAYYIMVGVSGSWLYEALHPRCEDEKWCVQFVSLYVDSHGWDCSDIQEMIDCSYEDILKYRLIKVIEA